MDFFSIEYLKYLTNTYLVPFGINLIIALLVFFIGRAVSRLVVRILDRLFQRSKVDESLRKFVLDLAYGLMLTIVVIAALDRLGIKTTAAVAILGALGLAVGFALQGSLGNFAAGVMIMVFKPYKVGDWISAAGYTGAVESVKMFVTEMKTGDNRIVLIPNGQIMAGSIENITARPTRRIDMTFGIGYGDDLKKAKKMIQDILDAEPRILKEPAYQVAVSELGDNSVNFVVRPWVATGDYWAVKFDLLERLKEAADANDISIPFPQRDVHMYYETPPKAA